MNTHNFRDIFFPDHVQYKCSCNSYKRLYHTYFCRHCMVLKCRECVAHEVDSQYCQQCLEYIPTIDPKFQKNKCASCYQCPSCSHLLTNIDISSNSTSITQLQQDTPDKQQILNPTDKVRQLVCLFCRWASQPFKEIDSLRSASDIAEIETPHLQRIRDLMAYYSKQSQKEKADKDKRRHRSRCGNAIDLFKKYGIQKELSPKLLDLFRPKPSQLESRMSNDETVPDHFQPSTAMNHEELEPLDTDKFYNQNFTVEEKSRLEQRFMQIELQPVSILDFKPVSKSLSVRRALRCKDCERNLCKNEYSPLSIKFKIQSSAYYHIPELKLKTDRYPMLFTVGHETDVNFTLQSQSANTIGVKIRAEMPDRGGKYSLKLPSEKFDLGPKDDSVEHKLMPYQQRANSLINSIWMNKADFNIKVTPTEATSDFFVEFHFDHDVTILQGPKEPDKTIHVTQSVKVFLGSVTE